MGATENLTDESLNAIEAAAIRRVESSPTLAPYYDIFIEYDWPNRNEHLPWVANGPEEELISWAKIIRRDEREDPANEYDF